jgi:hypothetical protein
MSFTIRQFKRRFVKFSITMKGFLGGSPTISGKNSQMPSNMPGVFLNVITSIPAEGAGAI